MVAVFQMQIAYKFNVNQILQTILEPGLMQFVCLTPTKGHYARYFEHNKELFLFEYSYSDVQLRCDYLLLIWGVL